MGEVEGKCLSVSVFMCMRGCVGMCACMCMCACGGTCVFTHMCLRGWEAFSIHMMNGDDEQYGTSQPDKTKAKE